MACGTDTISQQQTIAFLEPAVSQLIQRQPVPFFGLFRNDERSVGEKHRVGENQMR